MELHGVRVRSLNFLRGPNLHAYKPVMHVVLDIGPYEELPSTRFSGFVERITAWLPTLEEHRCGIGRPGGFVERLRTGTYLAHICEHVTLELQSLSGFRVGFGRARSTRERGVYNVVIAYQEEELARAAFETSLRLVLAAMHDEPFDFSAELERLRSIGESYRLGPSTAAIVEAARSRGVPVHRLTPRDSLVQLGWGVHQKRIRAAETSETMVIATEICQDKPLTNQMLRNVGVPVPEGDIAASADEAWAVAQEIGLPVVVKPADGNQGKGVNVGLTRESAVRHAYTIANKSSAKVLVERYIEGSDFRLLVVNGKMIAAARRDPPFVVGDGHRMILELVDELNRDPRRSDGHVGVLSRIKIDEGAELVLKQQNVTLTSVVEPGRVIKLRQNCNLSTGGTAADVTDDVHPSNARMAELAARVVGLDVAGIDVICRDIRRPLAEQGGAVIEVNASPGLRMHLHPSEGKGRDVGREIIEMLYPDDAPSRIPIIAVTGTNGKTTVGLLLRRIYQTAQMVVGMTSTEGIYVGEERIIKGDCSGPDSARTILFHPNVEVAVLETARGGILREGLGFNTCTVAVVTNVTADHLGLNGIETVEEMARLKQVLVESVSREGAAVLNADDSLVAVMATACAGRVVYFSLSPNSRTIVDHLANGGDAVFVDGDAIVVSSSNSRTEVMKLAILPFTSRGRIRFQVQNALAAVAAAWAAGLSPAVIAEGLRTIHADIAALPGRFNVIDVEGVQVVVDYGHNAAALDALGQAFEVLGRRPTLMLIGLPGDRRDEDIRATIDATRRYVDSYLVMDQDDRRGRAKREMFRLFKRHLPKSVPCAYVSSQEEGIVQAMKQVGPGQRLIIIVDKVEPALDLLQKVAALEYKDGSRKPRRMVRRKAA